MIKINNMLKIYVQFTISWKILKWHHHEINEDFSRLIDCSVLVPHNTDKRSFKTFWLVVVFRSLEKSFPFKFVVPILRWSTLQVKILCIPCHVDSIEFQDSELFYQCMSPHKDTFFYKFGTRGKGCYPSKKKSFNFLSDPLLIVTWNVWLVHWWKFVKNSSATSSFCGQYGKPSNIDFFRISKWLGGIIYSSSWYWLLFRLSNICRIFVSIFFNANLRDRCTLVVTYLDWFHMLI